MVFHKISTTELQSILIGWGQENFREYPWRDIDDPWLALVAEVLLQRTNATHVEKYYAEVCELLPKPESVFSVKTAELKKIDQQFGLDRKMNTLVALAEYIDTLDMYPRDEEVLKTIYGIGHYTAAAYLSLHMNIRAVLVDSNVARWLSRMMGVEKPVDVRRAPWLWDMAEKLTPHNNFKEYNYAVLDFTMTVCKPRTPLCGDCIFRQSCKSSRA